MSDDLTARVTARLTDADMFNVLSVDQRANTAVIAERMRKIILAAIAPELQDAERERIAYEKTITERVGQNLDKALRELAEARAAIATAAEREVLLEARLEIEREKKTPDCRTEFEHASDRSQITHLLHQLNEPFICQARNQHPDPAECDWPFCGCDEKASRVLQNLQENGWLVNPKGEMVQACAECGTPWPSRPIERHAPKCSRLGAIGEDEPLPHGVECGSRVGMGCDCVKENQK